MIKPFAPLTMVKPAELIEVKGAAKLTLANRRLFNVLLRHAFGPDLSDFTVTVVPEKTGRRVSSVLIGWRAKDIEDRKAAYAQLQHPRVDRKARITGTVEEMLPPEMIE